MRLPLQEQRILPPCFDTSSIEKLVLHYKQAEITFRFFLLLCVAFPYFKHFFVVLYLYFISSTPILK